MNKTINVKKGIYDTCYKLRENKDKSINIRIPYVKWTDNTGTLDFYSQRYDGIEADTIKLFFAHNEWFYGVFNDYGVNLLDILDRQYNKEDIKRIYTEIKEVENDNN